MKYVGYHRTSTRQQHLDRGIIEITKFCKENNYPLYKNKIYTDQQTGTDFHRDSYTIIKEVLEPGDALIITEIDRLGRDKTETMREIQYLKENHIRLMVLELPTSLMDLSKMNNEMAQMMLETINNMMLELYVSMAAAEMKKRKKRQIEGIEAMKLRGEWDRYGRRPVITLDGFVQQYQDILKEEHTRRLIYTTQNPGATLKPFTLKEVNSRIINTKGGRCISKASFYNYIEEARKKGINLNQGYESLFAKESIGNAISFDEFKMRYPSFLKEQQRRRNNTSLKPLTNKEIARILGITLAMFYRYRKRFELENTNGEIVSSYYNANL